MASSVPSGPKRSVYDAITDKIIAAIEAGAGISEMPWHIPGASVALPTNAVTLTEYRGINILVLWLEAQERRYASNLWASYRQWQNLGGQVRRGEHGAMVVFYKRVEERPSECGDHDEDTKLRYFARASWVFNVAQVDGFQLPPPARLSEFESCRQVEAFVNAVDATVQHGFLAACYRRASDVIEMPPREWFVGSATSSPTESYYAVLLHELTHWTGAPHRLNRAFGRRFGDNAYAMEELVAELGAAFMCACLGICNEPRPDHAAYIAGWLSVLKQDSRAIFTAARKAQEAFEHLAYLATTNDASDTD